jgi:hypothetical protein
MSRSSSATSSLRPANVSTPLVEQDFDAAFAGSNGLMEIGIPGASGYSIIFDNGNAAAAFLPAIGGPGRLTADLLDPQVSPGGSYAVEVDALTINTAYNRAGFITGTSSVLLQNLTLTGFTGDELWANGLTVGQALAVGDTVLGGGPLPNNKTSLLNVFDVLNNIDMAFNGGQVDDWADQHLEMPSGGGTTSAPEMDPTAAMGGMTLLLGALSVLRSRFRIDRAEDVGATS